MAKLLVISVTKHMLQNRVCNTITHVTLNAINGVTTSPSYLTSHGSHMKFVEVSVTISMNKNRRDLDRK